MKRTVVILSLLLILSGCKTASYTINRTGSEPEVSKQDMYQCKMDALNATKSKCRGMGGLQDIFCQKEQKNEYNAILKECLEAKGYEVTARR